MSSYSDVSVSYEGLINENYYKFESWVTELISYIENYTGRPKNPYNKNMKIL